MSLRFVISLLCNSYIQYCAFEINGLISSDNQLAEDDSAILTREQKCRKQNYMKKYVFKINRCIRDKGSQLLLPLVFGVRQCSGNESLEVGSEVSPVSRRPWWNYIESDLLTVTLSSHKVIPINGHTTLDRKDVHCFLLCVRLLKKAYSLGRRNR